MTRKYCILHANCQGTPLLRLLCSSQEFSASYEIGHYVNFSRQEIPEADLAGCSLFLYQYLGPEWGELASDKLLARLPEQALALRLPNPFFKGYWPLWTHASSMNFGDVYLDFLVDSGLELPEIMYLYLEKDLSAKYDLEALLAESQALERKREAGSILPLCDFVQDNWKKRQLFATINHPGAELLIMIADKVLSLLGMGPVSPKKASALDLRCEDNLDLPIHPQVGRFFGLPFAREDRLYPVMGKQMTFRQYAICYADCRKQGLNFLEYLAAVKI